MVCSFFISNCGCRIIRIVINLFGKWCTTYIFWSESKYSILVTQNYQLYVLLLQSMVISVGGTFSTKLIHISLSVTTYKIILRANQSTLFSILSPPNWSKSLSVTTYKIISRANQSTLLSMLLTTCRHPSSLFLHNITCPKVPWPNTSQVHNKRNQNWIIILDGSRLIKFWAK